jgi:hypothetical protein
MAQTPEQVQQLLRDIEAIYRRIGESNPFKNFNAGAFNDVNDAVLVLEQGLITGRRRLNDLINDAGELVSSFRSIVSEVKAGNAALTSTTKSFNSLTSIASKIQSDQAGINVLRKKELQSLQDQFKQEKLNLETNKDSLEVRKNQLESLQQTQALTAAQQLELEKVTAAHDATTSLIDDQDSAMSELNRKIKERLEQEEKIEKALGLGGAAIGAIKGGLDKLGMGGLGDKLGLDDVNTKMREMSESMVANGEDTDKFSNKMKVLKGGIKEAGKNLVENLKDPLAITALLAKEFVDALIKGDKATGELAKGFNMSYSAASDLRKDLSTSAALSNDVNISVAGLQESMMAVGKTLGTNVKLNKEDLNTFTKLREQAGMSNEELASMQKLTLATGGTLENNTGEFLAQAQITAQNNGVVLNTKQLLSETANVSDAIKLSLGGSATALAKAAATAKSLGMTLEQIDRISESLLSFESSISSELEAELLTGKDLTLEKARQAALNGDLATVGEEISKQLGDSAEFSKMNRIQQEALAKSVGMTREDLAKTLMEREALAELSGEEAKAGKATFDALVEKYDVETATQMIKEKGFKTLMDQQSIQERFNKGIEKLRDLFIGLAQPILSVVSPLIDLVNNILPLFNLILTPVVYTVQAIGQGLGAVVGFLTQAQDVSLVLAGTFGAILAFQNRSNIAKAAGLALDKTRALFAKREAGQSLASAALGAIKSVVQTPIIGPLLAAAAAAGVYALGKSYLSKGDDIVSPGYGKRTLMAPEGAIALNDKDTIIAGTDLGGGQKSVTGQTTMPVIDLSPLVLEMQNVKAVLQQILAKEGSVYIDSTKAGTAFAIGTSKL